eukprot:4017676-Pleurochrysis_carterae.AAC.3
MTLSEVQRNTTRTSRLQSSFTTRLNRRRGAPVQRRCAAPPLFPSPLALRALPPRAISPARDERPISTKPEGSVWGSSTGVWVRCCAKVHLKAQCCVGCGEGEMEFDEREGRKIATVTGARACVRNRELACASAPGRAHAFAIVRVHAALSESCLHCTRIDLDAWPSEAEAMTSGKLLEAS